MIMMVIWSKHLGMNNFVTAGSSFRLASTSSSLALTALPFISLGLIKNNLEEQNHVLMYNAWYIKPRL